MTICQQWGMMATITRKQRELQEREAKILLLARQMLAEVGYLGLSMDRIAAQMEYSKGTIYQHFRNKEEIILALANEALEIRLEMFQAGLNWKDATCTRDQLAAVGAAAEEFVSRYPLHFEVEQIVRSFSIWEKTSEERQGLLKACESRCMQIIGGVVQQGVADGDLKLAAGRSPEDVVFGLWAINFGAYTLIRSSDSLEEAGVADPIAALRHSMYLMLDGYQWAPLSSERDYSEIMDRVKREVFSDG